MACSPSLPVFALFSVFFMGQARQADAIISTRGRVSALFWSLSPRPSLLGARQHWLGLRIVRLHPPNFNVACRKTVSHAGCGCRRAPVRPSVSLILSNRFAGSYRGFETKTSGASEGLKVYCKHAPLAFLQTLHAPLHTQIIHSRTYTQSSHATPSQCLLSCPHPHSSSAHSSID